MATTHDDSEAGWTPKANPFDLILGSGAHMPVPYNEVHRLERLRAFKIVEMSFNEEYAAVVQTAMRVFDAEVRELHCDAAHSSQRCALRWVALRCSTSL
jgi:hypothetical protein